MHSLTRLSHQRGMYLTECPSLQGTVSSVLRFELLPCRVPNSRRQPFCPFRISLHYLMERPVPQGSDINFNLIVYSSSFSSMSLS